MPKTIAAALSALIAASPAAAQLRTVAPQAPVAPVVPAAPVKLAAPSLTAPLSQPVLPALAPTLSPTLASPSALPQAKAKTRASALPAAAALPSSVLNAAAQTTPAAQVGHDLGQLSREVAAEVERAGPLAEASPAQAQGLGHRLMELLLRPFSRRSKDKSKPLTPAGARSLRRAALNASTPESPAAPQASPAATKEAMKRTLDFVVSVFNAHYAPLDWKKATFGTELAAEAAKARAAVDAMANPTTREFQDILSRFTMALKDYHVGIQFYSTEMSMLPFSIVGAGGKYYLAYVDREALPAEAFPFKPGDEVTAFDGRPVAEVVADLLRVKSEGGAEATDRAMAERRLTRRIRQGGDQAPQGPVRVTFKSREGLEAEVEMEWGHVPELIPEIPVRDGAGLLEPPAPQPSQPQVGVDETDTGWMAALKAAVEKLIPSGLNPMAALYARRAPRERMNPYQIGGKQSFVPELGEVLWKSDGKSPFHAYIFKAPDGRRIGFVRVATYEGDRKAAAKFGELIKKFEAETDALVIDQVNNPGGSLFYMYALLSRLSDKPLSVPKQKVAVGEEDAFESIQTLMAAQQVVSEAQLLQILGPSLDGYKVTMRLWRAFVAYAQFIYMQLRQGKRLTDLVPFLGLDKLEPNEDRYTKPIMVLVNELDFSCADFFPAILQDNKRATIFGVRTSGAGGAVKAVQFPNQFGIAGLAYTWTIAMRANGQPIENLGVTPDVPYAPTAEDLADGYAGYKRALLEALSRLLGPAAPAGN